ncbi:hypothetical protein [Frigidibacter sp. SD6-1]|uniref:hypothetical protein n=1 Tax=Frigidibacter sp. SD6-1 TaxID=3032581 RepID=UPI0024DFE399|nr:hypothetical protein [Frigidibacter sp. SD6-1]
MLRPGIHFHRHRNKAAARPAPVEPGRIGFERLAELCFELRDGSGLGVLDLLLRPPAIAMIGMAAGGTVKPLCLLGV